MIFIATYARVPRRIEPIACGDDPAAITAWAKQHANDTGSVVQVFGFANNPAPGVEDDPDLLDEFYCEDEQ